MTRRYDVPSRYALRRFLRRTYWRAVSLIDPRCPSCHQRLRPPMHLTARGHCVECEAYSLWEQARDWGER